MTTIPEDFENVLIPVEFIICGIEENGEYYLLTTFGEYIANRYTVDLGYTDEHGRECCLCFDRDNL